MDVALQSSVWVTSPEFAGYLQKRGFHWRKLWKQRWVALHGAEIVYMDKEPTADNAADMAITKAPITSSTVIDRDDIDGHPHGFAIHINDGQSPTWYLRAENTREKKSWLMRLDHVHAIVRWLEDFEKVRVLGVGGTGIVYEILHKTNGQRYALKEMEIKNKAQMQMALSEAEMLKDIMENISHPNILHIEKVFQVGSKFYLVFPLCTGGELYDHVIRRGHFSEHDAAVLIKDLVSGLHQLHERDILHLDIKPENLLFESDRDDAMIKITDFGLSKIYKINNHLGGDDRNREPSRDELAAKLKAFSESGVLQRDKLRGTVGYMSPELILAGSCSKATDVWAAGVVLYILLCGRPPFQSKSNREILEKSARGLYTMEGEEWEGVSEEAKDLVKKMLIVDPKDRITTSSILEHPWIQMLDNSDGTGLPTDGSHINEMILQSVVDGSPLSLSTTSSGGGTVSPRPPVTQPGNTRKMSAQNLQGALKRLSGFVADRKTEKLATSFTRLVSSLNSEDQSNRTDLLTQFLHPGKVMKSKKAVPATAGTEEGGGLLGALSRLTSSRAAAKDPASASADEDDDDDEVAELALQALLNPDTRNSLAEAFTDVGANGGKLSIEQFIAVLKYFSFAGAEGNSNGSGNSSMMDSSSNSGMNPQQQLGVPALLFVRFVDRDGDGMISADDIFTTHALIMQMSAVFVKVIFRLYVEAIWYPGRQLNFLNLQRGGTTNGAAKKPGGYRVMEEQVNLDVVEPPRYITARHVSAVFEKLGYDASGGAKLFTVLCEALAKRGQLGIGAGMGSGDRASYAPEGERESTNSGLLGDDAPISKTTAVSASGGPERSVANTALVAAFTNEEDEIKKLSGVTENMSLNAIANSAAASSTPPQPPITSTGSGHKMDVNDFVRAAEIDPVLIKILLVKPKKRINQMLKKIAMEQAMASGDADTDPTASTLVTRISSVSGMKGELHSALAQANLSGGSNSRSRTTSGSTPPTTPAFPIANSIGRFARGLYEGAYAQEE